MNNSSVTILILQTMLYLVPVAAFLLLVGWTLRRQIQKRRVWLGWVLLTLIFVVFTATSFLLARYNVTSGTLAFPYREEVESIGVGGFMEVEVDNPEIVLATFTLATSSQRQHVNGFGALKLEYEEGIKYVPMEFNQAGVLVGPKEALPFSQGIYNSLKEHRDNPIVLTGKSLSYSEMKTLLSTKQSISKNVMIPGYTMYYLLRLQLITGVLILYYLLAWRRISNKEQRNMNPMKIQDL